MNHGSHRWARMGFLFLLVLVLVLVLDPVEARMRFIPWTNMTGGTGVITGVRDLSTIASTVDGTVFNSGSFTPTAGSLIVATFCSIRGSSADPNVVTVTDSAGLTWTQISEFAYASSGTSRARIAVYAAATPGSPAAMTVTGTYAGTISGCTMSVFEVFGTDVADGVGQCFVQTVSTTANVTGTSGSITLAAAGSANNRAFSVWAHFANEGVTPRASWSEIGDAGVGSPAQSAETQWRSDAFETTASGTWSTSSSYGGTAFEIKPQ